MIPRPYQNRVLDELWAWFLQHAIGNPIIAACVGAGKSLLIAMLAQRADQEHPGTRILVLVHQKELLEQNVEKLRKIWPRARASIFSAALGRKDLSGQIVFATIGSIYKHAAMLGRIDIVLADECHLINRKDQGMWRSFLKALTTYNPRVRVVGWTGTDFRGNGVYLTEGEEALFTHTASRVTMRELLDLGYLCPLVPADTTARIETSDVRVVGNDYVISELAKATDKAELVEATCEEIVALSAARRRCLVFAVTVEHAQHVCDALKRRGQTAAIVSGETPKLERETIIKMFRMGRIKYLVNVGVFTTGFDVQEVDFIALLRATKSLVLYVQIAGRGMRCVGADIHESIKNGKADCMWADFTDTTERLGPVDAIKGRAATGGRGKGEAPVKVCDNCGSQNPTSALKCCDCGAPFPEPERIKHGSSATGAAILSSQISPIKTVEVGDVQYHLHKKAGSPNSLRVSYFEKDRLTPTAREWVCLSHPGSARRKAERWWVERAAIPNIPETAEAALEWLNYDRSIIRVPKEIHVNVNEKYPDIVGFTWREADPKDAVDGQPAAGSSGGVGERVA